MNGKEINVGFSRRGNKKKSNLLVKCKQKKKKKKKKKGVWLAHFEEWFLTVTRAFLGAGSWKWTPTGVAVWSSAY